MALHRAALVSVLLPNATLGLRRRDAAPGRDSRGGRLPAGWGAVVGLYDGRTKENTDGTWSLGLDPALWPVRMDDMVIDTTGRSWLVRSADFLRNNVDPVVDWVRVSANLRADGGTTPGGGWFVARHADYVSPDLPAPGAPPQRLAPGLYAGNGPPAAGFGEPDDEYVDLATGVVYQLEG